MDFIRAHQPDIMLFLCGMCGILAVMTLLARSLPRKTKHILTAMEIATMMLLVFDRYCYIFEGDASRLGYYMVRISNGTVYLLLLVIPFLVTRYLVDILINEGKLTRVPTPLKIADGLFAVGLVLLVLAPFVGLYYTFDAENHYQRAAGHLLCYVMPFLMVVLQEWSIVRYRKRIKPSLSRALIVCIALPAVASVLQLFTYGALGLSLTDFTAALVVVVFYTFALNYLNEAAERARLRELNYYKQAQKKEAALFEQTTEALANAIDAKDKYTRGHSTRVALYSRQIARTMGLPDQFCEQVYFAALLHDVGKIGVDNGILNKSGKLTEAEFAEIKSHPTLGNQILTSIRQAPFLCEGAHYHHERYDGHGYPEGLAGEAIPEIARIIAVADAYDAMTSVRSYRAPLTKEAVREELRKGAGTQFDPVFAGVMLRLMDERENETGR